MLMSAGYVTSLSPAAVLGGGGEGCRDNSLQRMRGTGREPVRERETVITSHFLSVYLISFVVVRMACVVD